MRGMSEVVSLRPAQGPSLRGSPEDKIWAVIASVGKTSRIANIYASRDAALADVRDGEIDAALDAEIAKFIAEGPTDDEIQRAATVFASGQIGTLADGKLAPDMTGQDCSVQPSLMVPLGQALIDTS